MPVPVIVTMPPPPPPDEGDDDRRVPPELTVTVNFNPSGGLTPADEAKARRKIARLTERFYAKLQAKLRDLDGDDE